MNITFEQVLTELEKPENEGQIKYLENLKNLEKIDAESLKQINESGGIFTKLFVRESFFNQTHIEAFIKLSECKNVEDIRAYKQTEYFAKIKNVKTGYPIDNEFLKYL